jgi:hypothetical protein
MIMINKVIKKIVLNKKPSCIELKLKDNLYKPFVKPVGPKCSMKPLSIAKNEIL